MSHFVSRSRTWLAVALLACAAVAQAQPARPEAPSPAAAPADLAVPASPALPAQRPVHARRHADQTNEVVGVGHDAQLPAGEQADSVVAVFGSALSAGDAGEVVAVFGDARVTGPVADDVDAVFGNTYVDSKVGGDVVAVLGNVALGPEAQVDGDVTAVGGTVHRDPAAIVHGGVQQIGGSLSGPMRSGRLWVHECLLYGRPLALVAGLGWAWGIALCFLGFYVLLALLVPAGITRCVDTMRTKPGQTVLSAVLAVLLTPLLLFLLTVTVVGIPTVPLVMLGLFCARLLGTAAILAWLGGHLLGRKEGAAPSHPALAVLIGGVIVLALYVVPILGGVVYGLLDLLGLGVVVYTLISLARAHRDVRRHGGGGSPGAPVPPPPSPGAVQPEAATAAAGTPTALGAAEAASASAPQASADPAPPPAATTVSDASATIPSAALPRAGFWIRILALLLDALLVAIVMSVIPHPGNMRLIVLAAYGAVMWKLRGSTVGGMLFDLQVVRKDGHAIDWTTAIVRALGCFLSLVVLGLGFFWIAFNEERQAWHDKIAGTVVVRAAKGVSLV